jgi:hypothetical protein
MLELGLEKSVGWHSTQPEVENTESAADGRLVRGPLWRAVPRRIAGGIVDEEASALTTRSPVGGPRIPSERLR